MNEPSSFADENRRGPIAVIEVVVHVCSLCLNGAAGECHVPGCAFWMNAAPTAEVAHALRLLGKI